MAKGIIFDIQQLSIFDGPGIRTTVFLKGCPLRCMWCHNPEGLSFEPELIVSTENCFSSSQSDQKIIGEEWLAKDLANKLLKDADYLEKYGGGVTFSGGEPTSQAEFLIELLKRTESMHRAIETSGYCSEAVFKEVLANVDYVMMDIKLIDAKKHKEYTGVSNSKILRNLNLLKVSDLPFRIRIPVIPGVNDDDNNFEMTAKALLDSKNLEMVELLPYHVTAGAKYEMVQMEYRPTFDEAQQPRLLTEIFESYGLPCSHL